MPTNLVRSKQDEDDWAEARRIVDKQYPDKSPDDKDKSYWKLTTSIYENIKKNRGKKKMQKQASVGELLAGQLRLRKQADGFKRTADYFGGIANRLGGATSYLGGNWLGGRRGGGNVSRLDKITAGGQRDTAEYRPPWHGWYERTVDWLRGRGERPEPPMPRRDPMPRRVPLPAPAPMPFPIPRGIRGPWGRPDEQPNDPMDNERIRRLVEGRRGPTPGGGWGRPVDDSEIPLPSEDPGGWAPSNKPNTPPNTPLPRIDPEIFEKIKRDWKPRFEDPGFWVEPKSKPGSLQDWYWRNRPMSREL